MHKKIFVDTIRMIRKDKNVLWLGFWWKLEVLMVFCHLNITYDQSVCWVDDSQSAVLFSWWTVLHRGVMLLLGESETLRISMISGYLVHGCRILLLRSWSLMTWARILTQYLFGILRNRAIYWEHHDYHDDDQEYQKRYLSGILYVMFRW